MLIEDMLEKLLGLFIKLDTTLIDLDQDDTSTFNFCLAIWSLFDSLSS